MQSKVYIVFGYNGLLNAYGPVGASKTPAGAERIKEEHEYMLDKVEIAETELEE